MTVTLAEKYEQERRKRQNVSKGLSQFLDKDGSAESSVTLREDPWIPTGTPVNEPVPDGGHIKFVIVGAGFSGILAAIKLIQAGAAASPGDLLIVDPAGGFGGTWYWNRYPGLMCDIERSVAASLRQAVLTRHPTHHLQLYLSPVIGRVELYAYEAIRERTRNLEVHQCVSPTIPSGGQRHVSVHGDSR